MKPSRTIVYLEDLRQNVGYQINNRLDASYSDLIVKVREMDDFLMKSYSEDTVIGEELYNLPKLEKPSIFNQNVHELGFVCYGVLIIPYLFIIIFAAIWPIGIVYLLVRKHKKSLAIDRLRELDGSLGRLIFHLKIDN